MTPEFATLVDIEGDSQWLNTHWNPHFKAPFSGKLNSADEEQSAYWGIELMRQAAGTFPCAPTFGPGNDELLPHGDTANFDWQLNQALSLSQQQCVYAEWQMTKGYQGLSYRKRDMLPETSSAHYMILEISNPTSQPVDANLAWHTTLGSPFLERGCLIGSNCHQFATAPKGTEFDHTSALKPGQQFDSLSCVPSAKGDNKNLSAMPGYNGHSEFISGITEQKGALWSVCINPFFNLAYLTLIPFDAIEQQVNPSTINYWIHSGGRDFVPWADYQGGLIAITH